MKVFFIEVNAYRTDTSTGFANSWAIYRCESLAQRNFILRNGLYCRRGSSPERSLLGIRIPTGQAVRHVLTLKRMGGYVIETIDINKSY